ncbi:hypothetical protein RRG08_038034 [Elysia crispata]|uniref:Uncharacterized protein n=1 Tax=Elysia crispata TaxID=231223 RepID=A0AAE0ZY95_9GAST|nr:hypothetical protein RRG08_038034 [Elysia crispata]
MLELLQVPDTRSDNTKARLVWGELFVRLALGEGPKSPPPGPVNSEQHLVLWHWSRVQLTDLAQCRNPCSLEMRGPANSSTHNCLISSKPMKNPMMDLQTGKDASHRPLISAECIKVVAPECLGEIGLGSGAPGEGLFYFQKRSQFLK